MTNIKIVPATKELLIKYYQRDVPTMRAYVAVAGNEVHAVFGIRINKYIALAFSDIDETARKNKRAVIKGYRKFAEMAKHYSVPIWAVPDPQYPEANKFLEHVGFIREGEIYRWVH